jgi:hypothetical protein
MSERMTFLLIPKTLLQFRKGGNHDRSGLRSAQPLVADEEASGGEGDGGQGISSLGCRESLDQEVVGDPAAEREAEHDQKKTSETSHG